MREVIRPRLSSTIRPQNETNQGGVEWVPGSSKLTSLPFWSRATVGRGPGIAFSKSTRRFLRTVVLDLRFWRSHSPPIDRLLGGLSPGVKFKDAELLGMPWSIVVGKSLADGTVELRNRRTGEARIIPVDDIVNETVSALSM